MKIPAAELPALALRALLDKRDFDSDFDKAQHDAHETSLAISGAAIAGIAVGAFVLLGALITLCVILGRRRRRRASPAYGGGGGPVLPVSSVPAAPAPAPPPGYPRYGHTYQVPAYGRGQGGSYGFGNGAAPPSYVRDPPAITVTEAKGAGAGAAHAVGAAM